MRARMASPPAHLIEKGKKEALEAVRRATGHSGAQIGQDCNPLGLPQGKDRRPLELRVVILPGTEERERHIRCNSLCMYLANLLGLTLAFNSLSHTHKVLVLLLYEPREDEPHAIKAWFLQATGPQRHAAWQAAISREGALDSLQTESRLRHMERFFQERGQYGASELMRPAGPGSVCPETRERQRMENDLYIVTR